MARQNWKYVSFRLAIYNQLKASADKEGRSVPNYVEKVLIEKGVVT